MSEHKNKFGEAAQSVVLPDADHVRTTERSRHCTAGELGRNGTNPVDVGSSPTFSTNSEYARGYAAGSADMREKAAELADELCDSFTRRGKTGDLEIADLTAAIRSLPGSPPEPIFDAANIAINVHDVVLCEKCHQPADWTVNGICLKCDPTGGGCVGYAPLPGSTKEDGDV